jgi:outer membrane protein TolC
MRDLLQLGKPVNGGKMLRLLPVIVLGLLAPAAMAQEVLPPQVIPPAGPVVTVRAYTLEECIQIGLSNQPSIRAAHASLAAAHVQQQALNNMGFAGLISKDLAFRKKQACLGVSIASAEVSKVEGETTYGVTRNYFTVQYARLQKELVDELLGKLQVSKELAEDYLKAGNPNFTQIDVDKLAIAIGLYQAQAVKAEQSMERATAALREAMGLDCHAALVLVAQDLPPQGNDLAKEQLVALALARRAEIIQTLTVVDVIHLEVCAQGEIRGLQGKTFAAGSDIHARPVPTGSNGEEYVPAALGVEMPTLLVGHKEDRMNRAREFAGRAHATAEKTRNLITLEAENAFHQWKEADRKLEVFGDLLPRAKNIAETTRDRYRDGGKATVDDLIRGDGIDLQMRASYNQALYEHVLALSALERITAGGFIPLYRQPRVVQHP